MPDLTIAVARAYRSSSLHLPPVIALSVAGGVIIAVMVLPVLTYLWRMRIRRRSGNWRTKP
jgi:hypothetical protein